MNQKNAKPMHYYKFHKQSLLISITLIARLTFHRKSQLILWRNRVLALPSRLLPDCSIVFLSLQRWKDNKFHFESAIMAYKSFPAKRKLQKAFHATLHLIALLAGVVGVYTAFKFKYEVGDKDMASLHSWLGMITICLFGLQVCLFGLQVILFFSLWVQDVPLAVFDNIRQASSINSAGIFFSFNILITD